MIRALSYAAPGYLVQQETPVPDWWNRVTLMQIRSLIKKFR